MTTSGIYEIRNKVTGHCYIGSSINLQSRKNDHFWRLRKGTHHSLYLQRAFNKYGEDSFEWRVLEEVFDVTMLIQREQHWIDSQHPKYNGRLIASSNLGLRHSSETKTKMRAAQLGRKQSPEVIAAKIARQTGVPRPPETIEKIKVARAKQEVTPAMRQALKDGAARNPRTHRRGKTNSEEHNRKIAEAHRGMTASPESIAKMRDAKLGTKQSPELVARRIAASWLNKTDEEKQMIIEKRKRSREV